MTIELERRGRIALLTLAHGKANAFDAELCADLMTRVDECRDAWCAAVVITGRGSIFSAGVDLLRVVEEGRPYVERFLPLLSDSLAAVFSLPKPVVAAVNGHAIAGGCILACAADRRLMARGSGRIGVPELLVGVPFPAVPLEIMRFAAPARLSTLVFDGATFVADDAARHGLVDAAVEPDPLVADAVAAAEALAALPGTAFALTKRLLRGGAVERMDAGRRQLDRAVQDCWAAPDTLAVIRAYIQRTFKKGI